MRDLWLGEKAFRVFWGELVVPAEKRDQGGFMYSCKIRGVLHVE